MSKLKVILNLFKIFSNFFPRHFQVYCKVFYVVYVVSVLVAKCVIYFFWNFCKAVGWLVVWLIIKWRHYHHELSKGISCWLLFLFLLTRWTLFLFKWVSSTGGTREEHSLFDIFQIKMLTLNLSCMNSIKFLTSIVSKF